MLRASFSILIAFTLSAANVSAQTIVAIDQKIQAAIKSFPGTVSLYAKNLDTGASYELRADAPVPTASTIKLPIMVELFAEAEQGKLNWNQKLTLTEQDKTPGSGVLTEFSDGDAFPLRDLMHVMIVVSDNTATNLAIDRFGLDTINVRMAALGLHDTHLYKKVFKPANGPMPADQPIFGLGKSTPREMAVLMTEIGACRLRPAPPLPPAKPGIGMVAPSTVPMDADDKAVCDIALTMLKNQFYRDTIPRYLPNGGDQTVASKTGSLDAVRSDVAIIAAKSGPIVLSIFTFGNADHSWTVENEAERTIARLAQTIVAAWSPDGLDPKLLTPGLGLEPISTPAVKKP